MQYQKKEFPNLFFSKQKQAVSQTTYLNRCIIARLIPFIKRHHNKEKVLFWPDLPSSHYGHDVLQYLNENDVQFVDKKFNPQARPIETLWSILKNMVYGKQKQLIIYNDELRKN